MYICRNKRPYIRTVLTHIQNRVHASLTKHTFLLFYGRLSKSNFHSLLSFYRTSLSANLHLSMSLLSVTECFDISPSLCLWRSECITEKRSRFLCHVDDRGWRGVNSASSSVCVCAEECSPTVGLQARDRTGGGAGFRM